MAIEVELGARIVHEGKDMGSKREHLQTANPDDPRLKEPELEIDDVYYLRVFGQLMRSRPHTHGYPLPLSLNVFRDYMVLFEDHLEADEILLLQTIDDAFMAASRKTRE